MTTQIQTTTPTASQWASAASHLERRTEWVWFRVNGARYVAVPSGTSGRTYWVRADAAGCSCMWYATTYRQCAHMLAVELAALEDELREQENEAAIDLAFAETATRLRGDGAGRTMATYDRIWTTD